MCVILVGKIGMDLHKKAKAQNPDGFSCFTKELGLIKAPTEEQVKEAVSLWGIWHYRIRSSGKVSSENIHPFKVAHGATLLYHNGVLGEGTAQYSDTNCLARTLYNCSIETVKSVLQSLQDGQRFLLADSKDPTSFRLFGKWHVHQGILMSHKNLVNSYSYRYLTHAQRAGWEEGTSKTVYPSIASYKDFYGED